jgi:hypothetical protein
MNRDRVTIDWRFTRSNAREAFSYDSELFHAVVELEHNKNGSQKSAEVLKPSRKSSVRPLSCLARGKVGRCLVARIPVR